MSLLRVDWLEMKQLSNVQQFTCPLGMIVPKGSGSCLNQISGFEAENDTKSNKSIASIIGPQNVGPLEPPFDPDM